MTSPFEAGPPRWTGPPVDDRLVRRAEQVLGYRLPGSYVGLLRRRNGGVLADNCYPTEFATAWADDHFQMDVLMGIGYPEGVDARSRQLIEEWGYPADGVVIGVTAMAGPDAVMLDYADSGPDGEPAVAYVRADGGKHRVAETFEQFMTGFVPEDTFEEDDE